LPAPADHDELALDVPEHVVRDQNFTVKLRFTGAGDLHAVSSQLRWNGLLVSPVRVEPGDLARAQEAVVLSAEPGNVDVAVVGSNRPGLSGTGVLALVTFHAVASGDPAITIATLDGRDRNNGHLFVTGPGETPRA